MDVHYEFGVCFPHFHSLRYFTLCIRMMLVEHDVFFDHIMTHKLNFQKTKTQTMWNTFE